MMLPTAQQVVLGWDRLCSYLKGQLWARWLYTWLRGCHLPASFLGPKAQVLLQVGCCGTLFPVSSW